MVAGIAAGIRRIRAWAGEHCSAAEDIDTAIAGNRKVKLHYREKHFRWSWLGDTKHFVDKVELAG